MLIGYILLVIAAAQVLIGLTLIFRYQKKPATIFYGLFALSAAVIVAANGIGYLSNTVPANTLETITWSSAILLPIFFLGFCFSFPIPRRPIREILPLIIWPIFIFPLAIISSDSIIIHRHIEAFRDNYAVSPGQLMWMYIVVFSVYWIWGIYLLIKEHTKSTGYYRWFIRIVIISVFISLTTSVYFDLIQPIANTSRYSFIGSLFTAVWVIITSYLMLKK